MAHGSLESVKRVLSKGKASYQATETTSAPPGGGGNGTGGEQQNSSDSWSTWKGGRLWAPDGRRGRQASTQRFQVDKVAAMQRRLTDEVCWDPHQFEEPHGCRNNVRARVRATWWQARSQRLQHS
eukprot:jgi/Mesen1/3189/ME000184S02255